MIIAPIATTTTTTTTDDDDDNNTNDKAFWVLPLLWPAFKDRSPA